MANKETLLKLTLKKSTSGRLKNHQATAESLGLRHIGDTVCQPKNAATLGKVALIGYMLEVEEVTK